VNAGVVLAVLGAIAMAFSLIDLLSEMIDSADSARTIARKAIGQPDEPGSDMEDAMHWVRVLGLFLVGAGFMVAGITVWSS
jgi:uncharacterized membrane protein